MEMVKYALLILLVLLLISCDFFYLTPFPHELIFSKDYVVVDGIGDSEYTQLYNIGDYLFLYVHNKDDRYQLFIYTKELERVGSPSITDFCDTFAMKDINNSYCIGTMRYEITPPNLITGPNTLYLGDSGPETQPPYGFGFPYYSDTNSFNLYCMLGSSIYTENWGLNIYLYTAEWGLQDEISIPLDDNYDLRAVYYHEYQIPAESMVVLFFTRDEKETHIVTMPVVAFDPTSGLDYNSFLNETIEIHDIRPKDFYYTGDGYVIADENGSYFRYGTDGKLEKELHLGNSDYSEVYDFDGKTRYLFSQTYNRLIKTEVWW